MLYLGCVIMKKNKKTCTISDWLQVIIIALIIAYNRKFHIQLNIVKGESLYPTLSTEDRLLIIKIPYIYKQLNKGTLLFLIRLIV